MRYQSKTFSNEELHILSARDSTTTGEIFNGNRKEYGFPAVRISRQGVRRTLLRETERKGSDIRCNTKVVEI